MIINWVVMENNDPSKFKYFRTGDIVLDYEGSWWGDKRFTIERFFGDHYCPLCLGYLTGKPKCSRNHCNLSIKEIILVDARVRPMARVNPDILLKLIKAGNVEAKREFIIRSNRKKYEYRLNKQR